MTGYSVYGTPQWKFVDYSVCTPVIASGNADSIATAITPLPMNVTSHTVNSGRIITYSYAKSWTDPDDHIRILLNVPLKDASDSVIRNNWYSIPMADIGRGAPWKLERNTYYAIHVSLESIGSSGETVGDHPVNLEYRVLDDASYRDKAPEDVREAAQNIRDFVRQGTPLPDHFDMIHARAAAKAYSGMTLAEYHAYVQAYAAKPANGFIGMSYGQGFYKPMLEVFDYLKDNGFTYYVVSGTDRFACRALVEPLGIAPNRVIGMDVKLMSSSQGD